MLLLPLSWSVALSSTTFPHTSQTRPTTTSQNWCLSSTTFPHTSQTRPTTTSQKGCLSSTTFPHTSQTRPTTTSQKGCLSSTTFPHTSQTRPTTTSQKGCLSSTTFLSRRSVEARGKIEIWVQMQVSFFTLLNQKPTDKNNNQERDTPDGNVVLVSRVHETECNRSDNKHSEIQTCTCECW